MFCSAISGGGSACSISRVTFVFSACIIVISARSASSIRVILCVYCCCVSSSFSICSFVIGGVCASAAFVCSLFCSISS